MSKRFDIGIRRPAPDKYAGRAVAVAADGLFTGRANADEGQMLVRHDVESLLPWRHGSTEVVLEVDFQEHLTRTSNDGSIWLVTTGDGLSLVRVDARSRSETQSLEIGRDVYDVLVFDGAIWLTSEDGTITRIANS